VSGLPVELKSTFCFSSLLDGMKCWMRMVFCL
jgi:hypothetical protein